MDLPSEDAAATFDDYAEVVVGALDEAGDDVVVVGHSLAGHTIPLVAARRPVRRLVYLCALSALPGRSFADQVASETDPRMLFAEFEAGLGERDEQGRRGWAGGAGSTRTSRARACTGTATRPTRTRPSPGCDFRPPRTTPCRASWTGCPRPPRPTSCARATASSTRSGRAASRASGSMPSSWRCGAAATRRFSPARESWPGSWPSWPSARAGGRGRASCARAAATAGAERRAGRGDGDRGA